VVQELLFAFGSRRYGAISMLAMADILQATDYFLVLNDSNPDSRQDGYADDATAPLPSTKAKCSPSRNGSARNEAVKVVNPCYSIRPTGARIPARQPRFWRCPPSCARWK
jgi:hypothetical protein